MTHPILREVPTRLESERLVLRCPQPGDGPAHCAGVVESLEALRRFPASLPWALSDPSVEASEQFCREGQASYLLRTSMPMLLFLRETGVYAGGVGLHAFGWSVPRCEAGFRIRNGQAGRGLATEALRAVTAFAVGTLGMRRIEVLPDDENEASCRVCERAGYRLEGLLRNERAEPDGRLRNTRLYAFTP